jgi:plastocyanin
MKTVTALVTVCVVALGACGSSDDSSSSGGGYGARSSKNTTASASGSEIDVGMADNSFDPETISGKAGSTVEVELENTGHAEHNFAIDSQEGVDIDVDPGEDATVSVKIPASGSVPFYCEYHRGLGMVGTVKAS